MDSAEKKLIAFTGAQGTGKTTATFARALHLKHDHPDKRVGILTETASLCPYPINQAATELSQSWIFYTQIHRELDMMQHYDLIVCDRTCVDAIAYTWHQGFEELALSMLAAARCHMHRYRQIIFRTAQKNHGCFTGDGVRSTDPQYRFRIETELKSLYRRLNARVEYV
jgi:predicted ATPase